MRQTSFLTDDPQPEVKYPHKPGFKKRGTSEQAAKSIEPQVGTIKATVLNQFREWGEMTPDQCAKIIGLSILTVRPRCTELLKLGLLEETDRTATNDSGKQATILKAKD